MRTRPSSPSSRPTRASTAASSATATAASQAIVEARDATPEQLEVREVNSSIYVFRGERLWPVLERLEPQNAQGELYLTDTVALIVEDGGTVAVHEGGDTMETEGVNTRAELAAAAAALRDRVNEEHMLAGVTIVDPQTTWIDADVDDRAGRDHPPVHRDPRRVAHRRRAPRSARMRSSSTPRSAPAPS